MNIEKTEVKKEIIPTRSAEALLGSLQESSGNKILEIGLDEMNDPLFFAVKDNEVFVVDSREPLIDEFENRVKENSLSEKVHVFKIGTGGEIKTKLEDKSIDGVHSVAFLNGTILDESVAEISRILKSNGKAVLFIYEALKNDDGTERRFFRENLVEDAASANHLNIDGKREFWDQRHDGKTKVAVYFMTKK